MSNEVTIEDIKKLVAKRFKSNDLDLLFPYLDLKINTSNDPVIVNELLLLKAECYQRLGNLRNALSTLDLYEKNKSEAESMIKYEILLMKINFQKGIWEDALDASERLITSYNYQKDNVLWRISLLYMIKGNVKKSEYYRDKHSEIMIPKGFQEANHILYTDTLPQIMVNYSGIALSDSLEPVDYARDIYLHSSINFDTKNRIGSRLKSYCQALLVSAFLNWDYKNMYESYVLALQMGLCMKYSKLNLKAEGIGEIIKLLEKRYAEIVELIRSMCRMDENTFWQYVEKHFTNHRLIRSSYVDALRRFELVVDEYMQVEIDEMREDRFNGISKTSVSRIKTNRTESTQGDEMPSIAATLKQL